MRQRVVSAGGVVSPEIDELISASPAALIEHIIDRIEREHGSVAGYLRASGLDEARIERLRTVLVTDSVIA
jgi:protein-tyrosine phosphatase